MEVFIDFYNSLDLVYIIFFWAFIVLFIFMFIFSIVLCKKNRDLVKLLKEKEEEHTKEKVIKENTPKEEVLEDNPIINSTIEKEEIVEVKDSSIPKGAYQKNILRDMVKQTSPINLAKENNNSYLESVSKKIEDEMKAVNSDLTDYEKKQEDEAIISYKELQEYKDKLYNITEDEEDVSFIEELKSFRNNL